jgi:hypothetical protein
MKGSRSIAGMLHKTGGELLFIGYTVEQTQGTRAIAVHLNESNISYAEEIKNLNRQALSSDSGFKDTTLNGLPVIEWIYEKDGFRFVEFFFRVDTYNIRIAFWAQSRLFPNFLSVYQSMIASVITD